jgi:hypothetical protein
MEEKEHPSHEREQCPPVVDRLIVWLTAPPDRRSEAVGDLIENYQIVYAQHERHKKALADAWSRSEALAALKASPLRHVLFVYRVMRLMIRVSGLVSVIKDFGGPRL